MAKREYKTADDALTVYWNSDRCIHCGNCFIKMPNVFKPDERPWIKIDAEPSDKIAEVVRQCPSGASQYDTRESVELIVMPLVQLLRMAMTLPDQPRSGDFEIIYGDKR